MYTTKEVSKLLGITTQQIGNHFRNLGFEKQGRDILISEKQLEIIKTRLGKRGRPKDESIRL